ncbi:hypothetical protein J3R30DRAFT_3403471 [Lentinula aciculospora]|uniref:Fungal-type protein kinase domain-containing protein n=1 Tax=Lentinula aciculospora TaxID=153920 RepID=A0A9W9DRG9_9AGAR|nr:hypothetical protein J3R30DRAFT_3403471 [Lentinula aciculospora]
MWFKRYQQSLEKFQILNKVASFHNVLVTQDCQLIFMKMIKQMHTLSPDLNFTNFLTTPVSLKCGHNIPQYSAADRSPLNEIFNHPIGSQFCFTFPYKDGITWTVNLNHPSGANLEKKLEGDYEMCIMRGSIQEELYPILTLKTAKGCAQVFYDVVQCHHWAWKYPRILHCNISHGNIMVREKDGRKYGVLNDWDLATFLNSQACLYLSPCEQYCPPVRTHYEYKECVMIMHQGIIGKGCGIIAENSEENYFASFTLKISNISK